MRLHVLLLTLTALLLPACTPAPTHSTDKHNLCEDAPQIALESRIIVFDAAMFDKTGLKDKTTKILDNMELNKWIKVLQETAAPDASSPRVTLYNGQSGYIYFGADPPEKDKKDFFLRVAATLSGDRKSVELKATFLFDKNETERGGGELSAKCTLPDGDVLLMAGKLNERITRLPRNWSEIKTPNAPPLLDGNATHIIILIRPRILFQKETENVLFGPGYDKPTGLPNPNPQP